MPRNLDITSLRSFVAVADSGGVTRAAGLLNLTQSAVSMQIKRLEEGLDRNFFHRAARKMTLTQEGEQLLSYARRMLALNDEALSRLTGGAYEGELRIGVPHDIVYPAMPGILQRFAASFPRIRINLISSFTTPLKEAFERGELDLMLTTEEAPGIGGEGLAELELVWIGAPNGIAWQNRPVRLGFEEVCRFRALAQGALDRAGIPWEMSFSGRSNDAVQAMVAADLALTVRLRGMVPPGCAEIEPGNMLPELGAMRICLYDAGMQNGDIIEQLKDQLRCAYCC